jgi:hypothetical protein
LPKYFQGMSRYESEAQPNSSIVYDWYIYKLNQLCTFSCRFSSFQRQLNLYDFVRIHTGPEKGAYCHDLFIKDQPALCTWMQRNKIKSLVKDTDSK